MKNEKVNGWLRSKWIWSGVGAIILIIISSVISYNVGYSKNKAMVDGKLISFNDLNKKLADKNKTLTNTNNKVDDIIAKLSDKQSLLSDMEQTYQDTQTKLAGVIQMGKDKEKLKSEISDDQSKLSDLKSQISSEQSKLDQLKQGVQEAKAAPITLGAGEYVVGHDLQDGRYKVESTGGDGNFFVYDSSGSAAVNIILGTGQYEVPSYVFVTASGDVIKTGVPIKLIKVK